MPVKDVPRHNNHAIATKPEKKKLLLSRGREVNPNEVIPLDDTD